MDVSARQVRAYGAVASQKVLSRASSNRSIQLSVKREDTLPTYTREPAFKRYSRRLTSRFPIKISGPMHNNNEDNNTLNVNHVNDAASSKYSRDSTEIRMPDPAHHPANYSGQV